MKKSNLWMLAAILACATTLVATGCTGCKSSKDMDASEIKEKVRAFYGENKEITDGNYDQSLAVKCINGTFVGKLADSTIVFRGIPYVGKQPVGELRWKAPVDVVPDSGVYEAYYNAKSAPQPEVEVSSYYYQDENCLYLNVWKPLKAPAEKKPVILWIHGGAYAYGGTVDPLYDFHNFVEENPDVIVVSAAYRLGVFGFLHLSHLPDGKDYPDAQNLGLMDQLKALKWVHENIAAFGGDPDNVTLMGESAGGGSVTSLSLVEGSHQYFNKVIALSGNPCLSISTEAAVAATNELMEALGCTTVADLKKMDAQDLVAAATELLPMRTVPERDGRLLPKNPWEAVAGGALKDITFLQGVNKDEMNFFLVTMGGPEPFIEWFAESKAKKLALMTDEEKALVESYWNDVKGEDYEPYRISPANDEMRSRHGTCPPVQASGFRRRHGPTIRRDLLTDDAQDVDTVRQDRQPLNHCRAVPRRQGQGMAAIRLGEQAGDGLRRVQHPYRKGISEENRGLGQDLPLDQVLRLLNRAETRKTGLFLL